MDEMWRFAVAVATAKELKDIETPEQAMMRIQAGAELGLSPMWSLQNIMVVNGRCAVWGDALLGLVLAHPEFEDIIETIEAEGTPQESAVCEVRRRGRVPVIRRFSVNDVKRAGLDRKNQSVHGSYPQRMRQMRARSWACRDAFADALRGLAVAEEMQEVVAKERTVAAAAPMILPDEVTKISAQEPEVSNAPVGEASTVHAKSPPEQTTPAHEAEEKFNPKTGEFEW